MKKYLRVIFITYLFNNFAIAEEPSLFSKKEKFYKKPANEWQTYFKVGATFILPTFSVGTRYRSGQDGLDVSLIAALPENTRPMFLSAKALYQRWLDSGSGFYLGVGGGGFFGHSLGGPMGDRTIVFSLEQHIGYLWPKYGKTSFFLQLECSEILPPHFLCFLPIPGISAGFLF